VSKDRLVTLIQETDLFNLEVHRRQVLKLIQSFIRDVRTRDIRQYIHTQAIRHVN
jgi:hypothetical protein